MSGDGQASAAEVMKTWRKVTNLLNDSREKEDFKNLTLLYLHYCIHQGHKSIYFYFPFSNLGRLTVHPNHYLLVLWLCYIEEGYGSIRAEGVSCSGKGHGILSEMLCIIYQLNK